MKRVFTSNKKKSILVLCCVFLALSVLCSACGMDTGDGNGAANKDGKTTFTSTGGEFQLTVGPDWQMMTGQLHPEAELEIGSLSKDKYLIIIPELKADLSMELSDYTKIVADVTMAKLQNPLMTEPVAITVGDRAAYLAKVSGTVDGLNVYYWLYTIDCPDHFVQVVAWTLKSRKESYEDDIAAIVQSFQLAPKQTVPAEDGEGAEEE
ncbi:MAG: hypothetical protein HFI72_01965 [Peptococcaceae bacterium]|jgi:hypothetical protein|nr:hypothetical protein [Peptococcaceae bacterium]